MLSPRRWSSTQVEVARKKLETGDYDEALRQAERAQKLDPGDAEVQKVLKDAREAKDAGGGRRAGGARRRRGLGRRQEGRGVLGAARGRARQRRSRGSSRPASIRHSGPGPKRPSAS